MNHVPNLAIWKTGALMMDQIFPHAGSAAAGNPDATPYFWGLLLRPWHHWEWALGA